MHILIRHRTGGGAVPFPPFSRRALLSLAGIATDPQNTPQGFADTRLAVSGTTLAEAVYLSGIFDPPALCSGIGTCGLCRVRFLSPPPPPMEAEKKVLSRHDLDSGWRLACRHAPEEGMHILVPALPAPAAHTAPDTMADQPATLAVDLGTTSIHWRVMGTGLAMAEEDSLPAGVLINPQMGAGSDVISRIAFAATPEGAATLRRLVLAALGRMVAEARERALRVDELCVAANPAMTAILLGYETTCLARAPYSLPLSGGLMVSLPDLPPLYIPPLIAPFVGGDVSAGYAALALNPTGPQPEYPFLLADLGTNGECVLALSPEEALATSLPMGPALEGINLRCGTMAAPGAITAYSVTPLGLEPSVMGETAPTGITATGYLSLLRGLRATGVMTEEGVFSRPQTALGSRISGGPEPEAEEPSIRLPGKMLLTASDVEEILKVKAAFSLAVSRLLQEASLPAARLRRVFLAGSLGLHAPVPALAALGFLPPGAETKVAAVGNTSLAGAALFLARPEIRGACESWAARVTALDLTSGASLGADFARHMVFAWRS